MKFRLITIFFLLLSLTGCPLDGDNGSTGVKGDTGSTGVKGDTGSKGDKGDTGSKGDKGDTGENGISCWDLNGDLVKDNSEDTNKDGLWNANDCSINTGFSQNSKVELNHQHICKALANLHQYPEGCPSRSYEAPTGTLTKMKTTNFFSDGTGNTLQSCGNSPSNGLLSISLRDFIKSDGSTIKQAWFELAGGYIASQGTMSIFEAINGGCSDLCAADPKCIASVAVRKSSESSSCRIFYHSDTGGKYERLCGIEVPGIYTAADICFTGLGSDVIWASKCP